MHIAPQKPVKTDDFNLQKNTIGWKIFFWVSFVFMLLSMAIIYFANTIDFIVSMYDYADLLVSMWATVGLFGFAYYKPIFNRMFWRYGFYVILVNSLVYSLVLPMLSIERYGEAFTLDYLYGIELLYTAAMLYAVYSYAFKRDFIWKT